MINEEDYSVDGISIYSEEAKAFHEKLNNLKEKHKMDSIRDKLIDIILKVAMQHHDDVSKSDEDAACDAADEIIREFFQDDDKLRLLFQLQDNLPVESQIGLASGLDLGIKIIIDYVKKLLEKIKMLEDSSAAWFESERIFHYCKNNIIRPYPVVLCSSCYDAEKNFSALEQLQKYEELKKIHRMQAELLHNDVAFWGSDYKDDDTNRELLGIKFCIICNDVFAWGTADAEPVEDDKLQFVYDIYKKYKEVGIDAWCSLKRDKLEPQQPYLEEHKDFHKIRDEIEIMKGD